MKNKVKKLNWLLILLFISAISAYSQSELSAYYSLGSKSAPLHEVSLEVKNALEAGGFEIIGEYNPEDSKYMKVIVYTSKDLKKITFGVKDKGALAAALKVGLFRKGDVTDISMLNPEYLFFAYLRDNINDYSKLTEISDEAKKALRTVGNEFEPFGGMLEVKKLKKYHFMIGMPYFDDPVILQDFASFNSGVTTIQNNLEKEGGNAIKVYELIDTEREVAVFGVGLLNKDYGEAKFLPIIGEDHIAAMPFELIIVGKRASMLHGKYRIALHWPELSMGTFTKIMSTPGNVEDYMKALTK
ncbi:MAG: hypothetical protein U9N53_05125 [Bacteroidota bacterium]|nr:hypothetical protein [Bacteroidota bacterium]